MSVTPKLIQWIKILGSLSTATGSILLAWRVKAMLSWVKSCLVAHEVSIQQTIKVLNGQPQTQPYIAGSVVHLLKLEDKLGFILWLYFVGSRYATNSRIAIFIALKYLTRIGTIALRAGLVSLVRAVNFRQ